MFHSDSVWLSALISDNWTVFAIAIIYINICVFIWNVLPLNVFIKNLFICWQIAPKQRDAVCLN